MPIADLIHERGPLTVAAFMDLALYDPEFGYYARAAQRSGRAGDFFTSVDVGSVFGELLEIQLAEMASILDPEGQHPFDLVEAGAGNGRLSADVLRAGALAHPALYQRVRLHLVEASAPARAAHAATLGTHVERLATSSAGLPDAFSGVLFANELLDALPVHQVVMHDEGLREVYVDVAAGDERWAGSEFVVRDGPLSTPELAAYLNRIGVSLEPGWRAEINLRALEWIRDVSRRLTRGFIVLIDYGHEARELYSESHSTGTLTTFSRHTTAGAEHGACPWLLRPGQQDITAHVDFSSVRAAAEEHGLTTIARLDQTYFLLGLIGAWDAAHRRPPEDPAWRAIKTLVLPDGLGSTHKVLIFGKGVGTPSLTGCSFKERIT